MRFIFVHGGFHAAWCWDHTIAELKRLGHDGVAVDLPGHGALVDEESTLANRRDAIVAALQPGDVLVGHSGGGFDATLAADAAPEHVSHIVYLAAALPREGRTYPEAMAMRDDGDELGEDFDADVGEMLGYLKFDDAGAMTSRTSTVRGSTSITTATRKPPAGPSTDSARSGSATRRSRRCRCRTSGRPTCRAASSGACRTARCRAGWPTRSRAGSASNS
jgi:pimeloyl-ACP methyl ester carboxylesterase